MAKSQKRLGRGLSSLISMREPEEVEPISQGTAGVSGGSPLKIAIERIRPNPHQPRKEMGADELRSLANSIEQAGIIQPVVVRRRDEGVYELIAGERRWRAAEMAGLREVPAIVREATDEEMLEIALVENIFREDLNAIDRAMAYRQYCEEFGLSADEVAGRLGEDRSTVTNYLRLLELPAEVKGWVASGKLAMGHARCLLGLRSASELIQTAKRAMNLGLSVRALENLVRRQVETRESVSKDGSADGKRPQIRHLEEAFIRALGLKVEIQEARRKGKGKILIHYHNLDDFDRVAEKLGVET